MSNNEQLRLGEILIQKGWLQKDRLEEALFKQKQTGSFLGTVLVKEKYVTEEQLAQAISEQYKIPFMRLANAYIDWTLAAYFSPSLIMDYKCFPISRKGSEITIALANNLNGWALSKIEEEAKGYHVRLVLVTRSDMQELLSRYQQYMNFKIRRQLEK